MTNTRNVDPAEIARFEATASRWWDPEGEFRPLHDLNPGTRLEFIERRAAPQGERCSMSAVAVDCSAKPWPVPRRPTSPGIDLRKRPPLELASLHALEAGVQVRYLVEAVDTHAATRAGAYDIVTCLEMLEHVPDPQQIIASIATLVRPGGHVFFSTLNCTRIAYLLAVVGAEYIGPAAERNPFLREVHPPC